MRGATSGAAFSRLLLGERFNDQSHYYYFGMRQEQRPTSIPAVLFHLLLQVMSKERYYLVNTVVPGFGIAASGRTTPRG